MTRPRNRSPALCSSNTDIGTRLSACEIPATTRTMRPVAGPGIWMKTSSAAYQPRANTIIMRAGRSMRPVMLTAIEPRNDPSAKLATSVPRPVSPIR